MTYEENLINFERTQQEPLVMTKDFTKDLSMTKDLTAVSEIKNISNVNVESMSNENE